jgi:hypothetical protein
MLYIANVFTGSSGHFIQSLCAQAISQDHFAEFYYDDVAHCHSYMNKYRLINFHNYQNSKAMHWSEIEFRSTEANQQNWIIEASTSEDYVSITQKLGKWRRIFILVPHEFLLWQASNHTIKNRLLTGQDRTLMRVQQFLDESSIEQIQYQAYRKHLRLDSIYGSWTLNFRDIFLDPIITVNLLEHYLSRTLLIPGLMNYRRYLVANLELIQNTMPWLIDRYDAVAGIGKAVEELDKIMLERML